MRDFFNDPANTVDGKRERLPVAVVNEAVRWRLERNDCQNRGYVLDGYPKNYMNADSVFMHRPEPVAKKADPDGDGNASGGDEKEPEKPSIFKHIYPESVISLRASDQYIKRMGRAAQLNKTLGADKWEGDRLGNKMQKYNSENAIALFKQSALVKTNVFPTAKFFQENLTEVFEFLIRENRFEMFESMRIYVERNGRPNNYLENVKVLNEQREKALVEEEKQAKIEEERLEKSRNQGDEKLKAKLEADAVKRLEEVAKHMKELEECDDLNMR